MLVLVQAERIITYCKGVFMLNEEFLGRWNHLKNNMQHLWGKFSEKEFEAARKKFSDVSHFVQEKLNKTKDHDVSPEDVHIDNYQYESHRIDDLPLTLNKDPGPGIKYDYTENSEFARGAEKVEAFGIDSFGEEDTFDPEEADEHQDYRNRKHNSDLSDRFYSPGLDIKEKDLH
jgi:hypothetical protein